LPYAPRPITFNISKSSQERIVGGLLGRSKEAVDAFILSMGVGIEAIEVVAITVVVITGVVIVIVVVVVVTVEEEEET